MIIAKFKRPSSWYLTTKTVEFFFLEFVLCLYSARTNWKTCLFPHEATNFNKIKKNIEILALWGYNLSQSISDTNSHTRSSNECLRNKMRPYKVQYNDLVDLEFCGTWKKDMFFNIVGSSRILKNFFYSFYSLISGRNSFLILWWISFNFQ